MLLIIFDFTKLFTEWFTESHAISQWIAVCGQSSNGRVQRTISKL